MAEEKTPSQAQLFLSTHGEKAALGLAVLLLIGYVILYVMMGTEDRKVQDVRDTVTRQKREMKKAHPDQQPGERNPYQGESLDSWRQVGEIAQVSDTPPSRSSRSRRAS
ncbi:MAG: hypothetical protein ACYTAF_03765 [Planctomycetota bacterium]|jgi:hypothetical protein